MNSFFHSLTTHSLIYTLNLYSYSLITLFYLHLYGSQRQQFAALYSDCISAPTQNVVLSSDPTVVMSITQPALCPRPLIGTVNIYNTWIFSTLPSPSSSFSKFRNVALNTKFLSLARISLLFFTLDRLDLRH